MKHLINIFLCVDDKLENVEFKLQVLWREKFYLNTKAICLKHNVSFMLDINGWNFILSNLGHLGSTWRLSFKQCPNTFASSFASNVGLLVR